MLAAEPPLRADGNGRYRAGMPDVAALGAELRGRPCSERLREPASAAGRVPFAGRPEACPAPRRPRPEPIPDLSNTKGQETAKRALKTADAGGHNLFI